jgi:hypothetical protein
VDSLGEISLFEVMEMAAQKGAEVALKEYQRRKAEQTSKQLGNTELLLRNYRRLAIHRKDTVYSYQKAMDVLGEINYGDDEQCFKSLKKSADRTAIVVAHINKMMDAFYYLSFHEKTAEMIRGYKIIKMLFIDDERKNPEDICDELGISQRTFYRCKKDASRFLSALIFGVDSLKFK